MIPESCRCDASAVRSKGGRRSTEQRCEQQVVVDEDGAAHGCSGQVGIFGGDGGSERRVAACFVERPREQPTQPVASGGKDQQRVSEVCHLDRSALCDVPSAASLSRKSHLPPVRNEMAHDCHRRSLQDKKQTLTSQTRGAVAIARVSPVSPFTSTVTYRCRLRIEVSSSSSTRHLLERDLGDPSVGQAFHSFGYLFDMTHERGDAQRLGGEDLAVDDVQLGEVTFMQRQVQRVRIHVAVRFHITKAGPDKHG